MQYYIGCSGWSYSAWQGPFYPSNLDYSPSDWLKFYASVFNYVEIDSSFYKTPNVFTVKSWFNKTPENFKFTAKFPKVITHDKRLKDVSKELQYFIQSMLPLKEKTLALLLQLPPSLKVIEGIENLREHIVHELDDRFRYAVEVRDRSWFQDLAYNFFADNNLCMVWSQLAELRTPPIATTDFLYLRFIGDRTIDEKNFGKIQKDRVIEMKKWAIKAKRTIKEEERGRRKNINLAIVSANNHYAGFGPGTANIFRKLVGLPEAEWSKYDKDNKEEEDKTHLHSSSSS
ncbi:MAG: DUF72 domain-containing protein, partial [Nitrososphaeraceae archaeon]|nr:DUF72 domain-containing protein [Nitrososphaeraceae archaeon]